MTDLTIDLQEGFRRDEVIVRVNGADIWANQDVTTREVIGFAESFQLEVPEGDAVIEVELPRRSLWASTSLNLAGPTWLGVRIRDGRVELQPSGEPYAYL